MSKMKFCAKITLSVAAVILVCTGLSAGAFRIMPLGDSITEGLGSTGDVGYRRPLYLGLTSMGYDVDFVGSLTHGLYTDFDRNHEGHYAWYANQIRDNIITWLNNNPADIILLHIGTNDITDGQPPAGVAAEIGQILDNIDTYENTHHVTITVIVAMIIDRVPANPAISTLNYAIQNLYNTRKAAGDNLILVDMQPAINYSKDMYDAYHPNDNGYFNMAYNWKVHILDALSVQVEKTTVPDLFGMTKLSAETAISNARLVVGTESTEYSSTVPRDLVMSQTPAAGTILNVGSHVNFIISLGQEPQPATVPNIVGLSQSAAQSAITAAGLSVGSVTSDYSNTVAANLVMSQSPAAQSSVPPGSAVNFVLSLGPAPQPVTVPNIVGLSQTAAQSAITAVGFAVGSVTSDYSDTVAADLVATQNPPAGTNAQPGSAVSFVLSIGRPIVPNVVGLTQSAAQSAISAIDNLQIGTISYQSSTSIAADTVISQNPPAGTAVNTGSSINLVISAGDAYTQAATNGIVSIEAETYSANLAQNGRSWTKISTPSGSSGGYAMQALPDNGAAYDYPGYLTYSPRLDFKVNFNKTGTHYMWLRGYATSTGNDTVHFGLDNTADSRSNADRISGFALNAWSWKNITMDSSSKARINIPSIGIHIVNIWMREDGFRIDKIVLTTNSKYVPTDTGPPITK